ncbi:MAG: 3'(2'),5'-bisphosphate nucleotidase CysQ [Bacteroidota bacterium]
MAQPKPVDNLNEVQLMKTAIAAAYEAGKAIMEVYESGDFDSVLKSDLSPLTRADRVSHDIISTMLALTRIPMLSEEDSEMDYHKRKEWNRFWLVDPLDGTKEFLNRNGEFTVNIALIEENRPVMGVILVPGTNTLYFGGLQTGSHRIGDLSLVQDVMHDFESLLSTAKALPHHHSRSTVTAVASRSHLNTDTSSFLDSLKETHGEIDVISKGSSLKLCLVAEGAADVYPRMAPTMEWDIAAGDAIATAAGCRVIEHATGMPLQYNKEQLLNPHFVVYGNGFNEG